MRAAYRRRIGEALADAFLAGKWRTNDLVARGRDALGLDGAEPWLIEIASRVTVEFEEAPHARLDRLARFIADDGSVRERLAVDPPHVRRLFIPAVGMAPLDGT